MKDLETILKEYNRCKICIEKECKSNHKCHCSTCDKVLKCPKILSATIRITNRCTQKCTHCCFSSHPKSELMMSVDMARKIAQFIKNNNIIRLNVMGGEFFCNPDWFEILDLFIEAAPHIRLVSNSDWAHNEDVKGKLISLHEKYDQKFYVCLSNDEWHTNKYVSEAEEFLNSVGIRCYNGEGQLKIDGIVPVGRGELTGYGGFYSFMGDYCRNPEFEYSFLIDEDGNIYKCAFGTWKYANVDDYVDGGFEKRFKEYNAEVKNIFIPNCLSCRRSCERYNRTKEVDNERIVIKCE